MWPAAIRPTAQWRRTYHTTYRLASSQPPPPRPFKPELSKERTPREPSPPPEPEKGILSRLWPFSNSQAQRLNGEPKDPARGIEASRRVVIEGKLDPRYKDAARMYTALICALPLSIYLSYELWRRRFMGVDKKQIPAFPTAEEAGQGKSLELRSGIPDDASPTQASVD